MVVFRAASERKQNTSGPVQRQEPGGPSTRARFARSCPYPHAGAIGKADRPRTLLIPVEIAALSHLVELRPATRVAGARVEQSKSWPVTVRGPKNALFPRICLSLLVSDAVGYVV